jgi:hypothetical protein
LLAAVSFSNFLYLSAPAAGFALGPLFRSGARTNFRAIGSYLAVGLHF